MACARRPSSPPTAWLVGCFPEPRLTMRNDCNSVSGIEKVHAICRLRDLGVALTAAVFFLVPAKAAEIETEWIGPLGTPGSWFDEANWSNGVPNNTAEDFYSVFINAQDFDEPPSVVLQSGDVTISALNNHGELMVEEGNLTVDGDVWQEGWFELTGTFSVGGNFTNLQSMFVEAVGGDASPPSQVTIAKDFQQFAWLGLSDASLSVEGNFVNSGWTELGSSWDDSVGPAHGTVEGNLYNSGELELNRGSSFSVGGDLDNDGGYLVAFEATLTVTGGLTQQQEGVLTRGRYVAESSGNETVIEWAGADIEVIGEAAMVRISGESASIRDVDTGESAVRNLREVYGRFSLWDHDMDFVEGLKIGEFGSVDIGAGDFVVNGNLDNEGGLFLGIGTLSVAGSLVQQQDGVLTGGEYELDDAVLEWTGADIEVIGEGASVLVYGEEASMRDRDSKASAFRNLREVYGEFTLSEQDMEFVQGLKIGEWGEVALSVGSFTVNGDLDNEGYLAVSQGGGLTVTGGLVQQQGGVLTGGQYRVFSSEGEAFIEWTGADIEVIGDDAWVWLIGEASMRDQETGENAFRNLREIQGRFTLSGQDMEFAQGLRMGEGGFAVLDGGEFTINGDLEIDGGGLFSSDAVFTVNGDFDNGGSLTVEEEGTFTVMGALVQQQDGVLTGGRYEVGDAILEWTDANIEVIGEDVSVWISGEVAAMRDRETEESAFRNLREVNGSFDLQAQDMAFAQGLKIGKSGEVYLSDGDFTVNGDLDNEGYLLVWDGGRFTVTGMLVQQQDGVLIRGRYEADSWGEGSVLEWTDANIEVIGEDAWVSLYGEGASIQDRETGENALRNLREINGGFWVSHQDVEFAQGLKIGAEGYVYLGYGNFAVNGDLDNLGELVVRDALTVSGQVLQLDPQKKLTGGSFVMDDGVLAWSGARIETIGEAASIELWEDGAIRNSEDDSNALSALKRNEGSLSLNDHVLELEGGLENAGRLTLRDSRLVLGEDGALQNEGSLIAKDAVEIEIEGALELVEGGVLTIYGGYLGWDSNTYEDIFGLTLVKAGAITLGGEIQLTLDLWDEWIPSEDGVYKILEGDSLTGTFDGLADGSRVALWGDWDTGDREIVGTFAITYDYANGEVLLSNFAAIPEPGTTLLFGLGLATLLWSTRRKATR